MKNVLIFILFGVILLIFPQTDTSTIDELISPPKFYNPRPNGLQIFLSRPGEYDKKYATFSEKVRLEMLEKTKSMFQFGYDSYMKYAFPKDELNPILCTGRGPDLENP